MYEGGGYPEEKLLLPRAWVELSCQSPAQRWDWANEEVQSVRQVGWLPLPFKMSGAVHESDVGLWGRPTDCLFEASEARPVYPPALEVSVEAQLEPEPEHCKALNVWSRGERGSPASPKCGWFRGKLTLSPSTTSEDWTTQFSILPGRQSRMSNVNVIQVRLEVTNLKMFLKVKVKDEKKKLGECKAEIQPKTARRLRFSCDCTKHGEWVFFSSIQPTFGRVPTPRRASRGSRPSPRSPTMFPTPSTSATGTGSSRTRAMYVQIRHIRKSLAVPWVKSVLQCL